VPASHMPWNLLNLTHTTRNYLARGGDSDSYRELCNGFRRMGWTGFGSVFPV
jgi:hypothetical protein